MANFNPAHRAVLDDLLLCSPRLRPGTLFGFPAVCVNKTLAVFTESTRFIAAQQEASMA
ncbi:MAG: hypothetical protein U0X20_00740 [Caldilineaceae bacterium]